MFVLNFETFEAGLNKPETYCDRGQPGQVIPYKKNTKFEFTDFFSEILIFSLPNLVESERYGEGEWTLVYDEGLIVKFGSIVFNTFFFYYKQGDEYKSVCSKTTKGWYRGSNPREYSNWGCFYAERIEKHSSSSFLQLGFGQDTRNSIQIPIQATFVEPPAKRKKIFKESLFLDKTDQESLTYYWDTALEDIDADYLPESWDWSNISGKSYISSQVRQQGSCGSCYAITTAEMLESRLKILTSLNFTKSFSIQYLISCSFYTEGCSGGFPTLLFKLIQEFGIQTDDCMPYTADEPLCKECEKPKVFVKDFYYIGGYYGATNEVLIMKEVRARGPVIIDFDPGKTFAGYREGVLKENGEVVNGMSMRDRMVEWERVTHSVLLVGWGVENGEKFWKCLNSWGEDWGEKGFFRIRRGTDEDSIESMAEAAVPYLVEY